MSDQIRVLFFHIDSDSFTGGSKMLLRLLRSINKDQFNPVLLSNANDELSTQAQEHGIEVNIIPFRGILDTYNRRLLSDTYLLPAAGFRSLQFNLSAYPLLRNADIIWCKNLRAVLTLLPHLVVTATPMVWNIGLGLEPVGKVKYLKSIALRTADYVFIESEQQASRIFTAKQYDRHKERFAIFHKGINTSQFDPSRFEQSEKSDYLKIGTAASLTPRKRIEYLIDAVSMVLENEAELKLSVAGEAPEGDEEYEQMLKERIQSHGIREHIEFQGWVEDMPQYLSTLDVFVLPSSNEGIPGAVREALAMKVPVIATDVGGTSEAVVNGKTGYLVEPEDAEQIAEKIMQLLNNKSERKELGKQGRKHMIENFSIENYVQDYETFFKDIAGESAHLI